jgi:hypothetical protein
VNDSTSQSKEKDIAFVLGEVRTYAYLLASAKREVVAAQATEITELEKLLKSINAIVFIAFFMEAFLNHIGSLIIKNWKGVSYNLSPIRKLNKILKELSFEENSNLDHIKNLNDLFRVRNLIAHGQTKRYRQEINESFEMELVLAIQSKWESSCTPENAAKLLASMESLGKLIYAKAGIEEKPFSAFTVGSLHVQNS